MPHQVRLTYDRLQRLQALTSSLSWGLTDEAIGRVVLDVGLELLQVKAANLSRITPEGGLRMFAHHGYPPEAIAGFEYMPPDAAIPNAQAVRERAPIFLRSREEIDQQFPNLSEVARAFGDHAWAAIPLMWEDRPIGAMGLSFGQPRSFLEDERDFLTAVAQQCAIALERSLFLAPEQVVARLPAEQLRELRALIDRRLGGA